MKILYSKLNILLILIGSIVWSLTMVKSGLVYDYGMGFWGPNGHDGIWHVALINSLSEGKATIPIFAGEVLKNYHIGFDMLTAFIHNLTGIPVITLYFQIMPTVFAMLIGILVYKFVLLWRGSKVQAFWSTFFVYFSGSLGWVITFLKGEGFNGESLFWAQQSLSTLVNPPFAFSLIMLFLGLLLLQRYLKIRSLPLFILTVGVLGLLIQIKIYSGILIIAGLFVAGVANYIKTRDRSVLYIFAGTLLISVILLIPAYDLRSKSLIFAPFWFLESMVATTDRFYWPKMASALANYKLTGNIIKGTLAYSLVLLLFMVGNSGIRILGASWLIKTIKSIKKTGVIESVVISIILFGILIPLCFIQSGNSWNSIQFFYYSLVFLSVTSGIVLGEYYEKLGNSKDNKSKVQYFLKTGMTALILLVMTIPPIVATLRHYLPERPPAKISSSELQALKFLKNEPDGVVLTLPFDKKLADMEVDNPPRPLYLYESTAYVSALTGKEAYLEDEVNLEITDYEWKNRKLDIQNNIGNISYLKELGITYIYIPDIKIFDYKDEIDALNIYNKDGIAIYKI